MRLIFGNVLSSLIVSGFFASTVAAQQNRPHSDWLDPFVLGKAVFSADLNQLRGGYTGGEGVTLNFGLDKVVKVDGAVIYQNRMRLSLDQAGISVLQMPTQGALIQVGEGNTYQVALPSDLVGQSVATVIQNSVDSKVIHDFQALNLEFSHMGKMSNQSMQSLLIPQLIESLRY